MSDPDDNARIKVMIRSSPLGLEVGRKRELSHPPQLRCARSSRAYACITDWRVSVWAYQGDVEALIRALRQIRRCKHKVAVRVRGVMKRYDDRYEFYGSRDGTSI